MNTSVEYIILPQRAKCVRNVEIYLPNVRIQFSRVMLFQKPMQMIRPEHCIQNACKVTAATTTMLRTTVL